MQNIYLCDMFPLILEPIVAFKLDLISEPYPLNADRKNVHNESAMEATTIVNLKQLNLHCRLQQGSSTLHREGWCW